MRQKSRKTVEERSCIPDALSLTVDGPSNVPTGKERQLPRTVTWRVLSEKIDRVFGIQRRKVDQGHGKKP